MREGAKLVEARKWEEAKVPLKKAIELYPGYVEDDSGYLFLARVYRELGDKKEERALLEKFVGMNGDALDERLRLMEMGADEKNWGGGCAGEERGGGAEAGAAIWIPWCRRCPSGIWRVGGGETGDQAAAAAIRAYQAALSSCWISCRVRRNATIT